ncbi:MAG: metal-dependent hydrolase [bacterium]
MATWFTHPLVPIALSVGLGQKVIPPRLLAAGVLLSVLPDLDVVMYQFGVSWSSIYGHRGFTHSIGFAAICAVVLAFCFRERNGVALLFGFLVVMSHALLDAMTWGGQGVAIYWPLSGERILMQNRPLPASPLDVQQFLRWGGFVLRSEFKQVWLPLMGFAIVLGVSRRLLRPKLARALRRRASEL